MPSVRLTVLLLAACALLAQDRAPRFVSSPDVHGDRVAFTWEDDLWIGALKGGPARRLTTHPGVETGARFSPDGKWIAFLGRYDGAPQVYLMPAEGGTPKRLTWRGAGQVLGWTPDGSRVLYRAVYEYDVRPISRLYTVDLDGHEPEALPLKKATEGAFHADGRRFLFSTRGDAEYYWKRYKGGQAPDLWLGDLTSNRFEKLTDYAGKNGHPMWIGDKVLFTSDRAPGGLTDLYAMDPATRSVERLTDLKDFDAQQPSTDGRTVVFVQGGHLQALDLATKAVHPVPVSTTSDGWKVAPRPVNPKDWIQSMSLTGANAVFEARGEVFLVPIDATKPVKNLTKTPGVRERMPRLSPDGKRVAYFGDASGDYDLYVQPVDGTPERVPTGLKTALYHLEWSPDGTRLLFGDKSFAIYVMDLATKKLTRVDESHELKNDQFTWEVSDYAWGPDSQWIAYSFVEPNHHSRIYLYNLATRQKVALTDGFFDCLNPRFDLDGSTLYFLSYSNYHTRLDPSQDNHIQPAPVQVMAVKLRAGEAKPSGPSSGSSPFRIDLAGLSERIEPLPVKAGNLFHLKAGRGLVGWDEIEGWDDSVVEEMFWPRGADKWKLHLYDSAAKKDKEVVLTEPVSDWAFDAEGRRLLIRKGPSYHVGEAAAVFSSKALPEKLDLERLSLRVDPRAEWKQIFEDTWRWYRDFFYDKDMNGNDWNAIGAKFRAWLPELNSRQELNWLLSQMVGELSASHTYVGGGDLGPTRLTPSPVYSGHLGADIIAENGVYKFSKVYGPTAYARDLKGPLADPAPKVQEGEYLLAIDGQPLRAPEAIQARLQVIKGQKVTLTVNAKPTLEGARTLDVEPIANDWNLRYERWIAGNIAAVDKASNGQLGYLHLTAMGDQNIGQFDKYWRAFRYKKGLVIDVRGNGGGWTEYFMIDKLERKQVGFNVMRGMAPFRYPNTASDGRYVFLSNEQNGSDGEAFLMHVKARNLGTIVGVPSWGGLVGIINTQFTLDGGTVEQSNNGFYGKEGRWWVENHGADPDLTVENDPGSLLQGRDPQLEVGIATLLKQLKENPTPAFPPVPAYPKR
ncbi:MAG: PD40 domain-containing protein [Holophagaceae bacterium]|uniref:Tricorn protease homolog n=1 Tax=Candidatus Geothrix skivensis TaxID=2954439 RepID=A0A9D7SGS2_9BACT|nr:PD40 domain-containing protein [Candidatus Geothrix skivensis]